MADERGDRWEFDRGPAKNSGWPELFAQTPNYRGVGHAVLNREVFRWHFGPMFYRGRLDGSARVLIIGQEGAQDESLSHRSFTGGTGGRMQHFLRHIGLDRSYLFLNTFVYPIFGEYPADLRSLAQNPVSPIVEHRHRIFDKVLQSSDVRLVVAVGGAAKESVKTWIEAHGGDADPAALHLADGGTLPGTMKLLGVKHPGGATAGNLAAIKADFVRAANQVATWVGADSSWLPPDAGMARDLAQPFRYSSAAIPHRDFPFGFTPRLGNGGTASNRKDGQRSIQLFSEGGRYNAVGASLDYTYTATGSAEGYDADSGDVAVEPPRSHPRDYDPGPSASWARLLSGAESGFPWPDFPALGVTAHASLGVGPIYRGRLTNVTLAVLTDPAGPDDLFTGRALTGDAGQRFQQFLRAAGLTSRYVIIRTVPVDTTGMTAAKRDALMDRPEVRALHREVLRRLESANSGLAALLAIGRGARRLAPHVRPPGLPVIELKGPGEPGAHASWQAALDELDALAYPPEAPNPTFQLPTARGQIPRGDLPYGTPRWIGTSGDRASRPVDLTTGKPSPDYLKLYLPTWVTQLPVPPLTATEQAAAAQL